MDGPSTSRDLLVGPDAADDDQPYARDNAGLQDEDEACTGDDDAGPEDEDHSTHLQQSSPPSTGAGSPPLSPSTCPALPPPPVPPDLPPSPSTVPTLPVAPSVEESPAHRPLQENGEVCGSRVGEQAALSSIGEGESSGPSYPTATPPQPHLCHSRGASQVSSCDPSLTRFSGREYCHSRGASTDGSLMDGYQSSVTDSRRGTYSEAGTLPIGSTIIEESQGVWGEADAGGEDKKLQGSRESGLRQVRSLASCYCCHHLLRSHHQLPAYPSPTQRLAYALTCPPHGRVGTLLLWVVLGLGLWGCLVSVTGAAALPGGNLFSLLVLYVGAVVAGHAMGHMGLPPLLGSLLVGILFSSVPGMSVVGHSVDIYWSSALRNLALIIILIRAGLGLDPEALRRLSCVVLRLAFLPCLVEACAAAITARLLLQLPWLWAFMLGFIVAAVSPAVVVPGLLQLGEAGYGVEAGIPTLVIAAASLDDVLSITGFSVMLGLTFAQGSLVQTVVKGPVEVLAGLAYGTVLGALCWFLPPRDHHTRPLCKVLIITVLGALGMFGSHKVGLESSGPIAVLTLAFIAGLGWRRPGNVDAEVATYFRSLWEVFQPMLFVLIGAEINVGVIEAGTVGWGLLTLLVCLSLRVVTSFLAVTGASFRLVERLFIAIAWLPKATVQAAIGTQALDYVRKNDGEEIDVIRGKQLVTIAVMVILVTAPIGAAAIKLTGPRFLKKKEPSQQVQEDDPETTV